MFELPEPNQAKFEKFFRLLEDREVKADQMTPGEYDGAVARAAVDAGWFEMDVDNSNPKQVHQAVVKIQDYVKSVYDFEGQN